MIDINSAIPNDLEPTNGYQNHSEFLIAVVYTLYQSVLK